MEIDKQGYKIVHKCVFIGVLMKKEKAKKERQPVQT